MSTMMPAQSPRLLRPQLLRPKTVVFALIAVMTAYAIAAAAIPLPILPDRMLARVRGAVVHDIVSRHRLSLTSNARALIVPGVFTTMPSSEGTLGSDSVGSTPFAM